VDNFRRLGVRFSDRVTILKRSDFWGILKPMRLNFAIFAQGARILGDGGLDIYNPITDLTARVFPAVHAESAAIINFLPEDTNEHELSVSINGGYKKDCTDPYKVKIDAAQSSDMSIGHVVYFKDITFEQAGEYKVEVSIDGEILSTQSFIVRLTDDDCPMPGGGCEGK